MNENSENRYSCERVMDSKTYYSLNKFLYEDPFFIYIDYSTEEKDIYHMMSGHTLSVGALETGHDSKFNVEIEVFGKDPKKTLEGLLSRAEEYRKNLK